MTTATETITIVREGAALYTSDEVSLNFIQDAIDIGMLLTNDLNDIVLTAQMAVDSGWIDDTDVSTDLDHVVHVVESMLFDNGFSVDWHDGYTITNDPLFGFDDEDWDY